MLMGADHFRVRTQLVKTFGGQIQPLAIQKKVCFQAYDTKEKRWQDWAIDKRRVAHVITEAGVNLREVYFNRDFLFAW